MHLLSVSCIFLGHRLTLQQLCKMQSKAGHHLRSSSLQSRNQNAYLLKPEDPIFSDGPNISTFFSMAHHLNSQDFQRFFFFLDFFQL